MSHVLAKELDGIACAHSPELSPVEIDGHVVRFAIERI